MILAAIGFPLMLAYILVAADMRTDLSELKPAQAFRDSATALIGWPDLEIGNDRSLSEQTRWQPQHRVEMLGYMMDGDEPFRDGEQVTIFILMPEAGQFLHPAHRIPDEMVEIRLARPSPFQFRRLVWAAGMMAREPGRRKSRKAAYAMNAADVQPALQTDITLWFRP